MPEHLPTSVKTFGCSTTHPTHLAFTKMGHGPCWAIATFARGNKFAVIAIEYFTRWIEAKPLVTITSKYVNKIFWQNIICKFRVPRTLMVDNGKHFDSDKFKEFYKSLGITLSLASVYHLESNEVVERANRIVFLAI
jgi:transposase InsO family protein